MENPAILRGYEQQDEEHSRGTSQPDFNGKAWKESHFTQLPPKAKLIVSVKNFFKGGTDKLVKGTLRVYYMVLVNIKKKKKKAIYILVIFQKMNVH